MSSLAISGIVFGCVVVGALVGMALRAVLPEHHLSSESKEVVKLGMGLVATMTALVIGLMVASAKSSFDTQNNGVAQLAANVIMLDRALAHYGPESNDARETLRASIADMLQQIWPDENSKSRQTPGKSGTEGRYEMLYDKIQELAPKNDTQRAIQAQALKTVVDTGQLRWSLYAQEGNSIPTPFLAMMVFWLTLLFVSFGLFAPPNTTVAVSLMISALAVSTALFLILELDRPFEGVIHISSDPLRNALAQLGR